MGKSCSAHMIWSPLQRTRLGKLWKFRVPAKVKNFTWKTLHGALPCRVVLANRHMNISGQCPLCATGAEDIFRMLFKCTWAAKIWNLLECQQFIAEACEYDHAGSAVLEFLLCSSFHPDLHPMDSVNWWPATACWYLWWERHKI